MTLTGATDDELLQICKESQGEYLLPHQPKGAWSTRYSSRFIAAAAQLYARYSSRTNYPELWMAHAFVEKGIRSCRGAKMDVGRVDYLVNTHLVRFLKNQNGQV